MLIDSCLPGHYQGHFLSGSAMMYSATGDARIKAKAAGLVAEMAKVQEAWTGKTDYYGVPSDGFLFPNYADTFGIMEGRCGMPGPKIDYSVPYYTLHKLMAGLLDQYQMAGNTQAFSVLKKLADWVVLRVDATLKRGGQKLWQCVLSTEWGGMNEVYPLIGHVLYTCMSIYSIRASHRLVSHHSHRLTCIVSSDDMNPLP